MPFWCIKARTERPGLPPDSVRVASNVITNAVSCGIYVAGGRNIEIIANRISGQSDRWDATLPEGATQNEETKEQGNKNTYCSFRQRRIPAIGLS